MNKIIKIEAFDFYLICTLSNGEVYKFDMNFVKTDNSEMTKPLQDINFFKKVFIELGSLTWPNGYDIHVSTIVTDGEFIKSIA